VFYGGSVGGGKAQPFNAEVVTPFGIRTMGDMEVGSIITCPSTGGIQRVIQVHERGNQPVYRVKMNDGSSCVVAGDHLWKYSEAWKKSGAQWKVADTVSLMEMLEQGKRPMLPVTEPVSFTRSYRYPEGAMPMDPYLLGLFLGDGSFRTYAPTFTTADQELFDFIVSVYGDDVKFSGGNPCWGMRIADGGGTKAKLEKMGLWKCSSHTKFIPEEYKVASEDVRLAILQGLMDTDGFVDGNGRCEYSTVSRTLAKDVKWLVDSLGGRGTIRKGSYKKDGQHIEMSMGYGVHIQIVNKERLFRLTRKKQRATNKPFNGGYSEVKRRIVSIRYIGKKECRCITVDHIDGLYLTNGFIVTHNSDALLMAALQYVDVPFYAALIVRSTYKDLSLPDAIMSRSKEWLMNSDAHWSEQEKTWTFPSGAKLVFGHLDGPNDHYQYQSAAFQFIGIDEASQLRWNQIMYLFSRVRKTDKVISVPLRVRLASNPGGTSHDQIKERYIDSKTRKEDTIFIPAWLEDNPYLDQESYDDMLNQLDHVTRKQLREGNWDVTLEGNLFQRHWFNFVGACPVQARKLRWWDLAATDPKVEKGKGWADYTVGIKMSMNKDGLVCIEDIVRERLSPLDVEKLIVQTAELDGRDTDIWMEQEPGSSGKANVDRYRRLLAGFTFHSERPTGGKSEYARPFSAYAEAGNVSILRGLQHIMAFLAELDEFPIGSHDDMVDATSKAFSKLTASKKKAGVW